MSVKTSPQFLRYVLWADAVSCLACGILQVGLTVALSSRFGLSQTLLFETGVFLLLYGTAVGFLATRNSVPKAILWVLIVGNVLWGVSAVGILLMGDARITLLGKGYIVAQALMVMILAQLQLFCARSGKAERLVPARQGTPHQ
jgi:hypothetical protein